MFLWPERDVSNYQFSKHYFALFKHITRLSQPLQATPSAVQPVNNTYRHMHAHTHTHTQNKLYTALASCLQLTNHNCHHGHHHHYHHHHTTEHCTVTRMHTCMHACTHTHTRSMPQSSLRVNLHQCCFFNSHLILWRVICLVSSVICWPNPHSLDLSSVVYFLSEY